MEKLGLSHTFICKSLAFSFDSLNDNSDFRDRYIFECFIDEDNKYILHKTVDNRIEFVKVVNGNISNVITEVQQFSKWQVFNIIVVVDANNGTKLRLILNGGLVQTVANNDISILKGDAQFYLHGSNNLHQGNYYLENLAYITESYFNDDDICKDILSGANTIFINKNLIDTTISDTQNVNVLPNNYYKLKTNSEINISGQYSNINLTSKLVTTDTIFKTSSVTNNIKLTIVGSFTGIELTRCDLSTDTTWGEEINNTWGELSQIEVEDLDIYHGGVI